MGVLKKEASQPAQNAEQISKLLNETKTGRLRHAIRVALIDQEISISEAITVATLHAEQAGPGGECAAGLVKKLKCVENDLRDPMIGSNQERRRAVISSALRRSKPKNVSDRRRKAWRREDMASQVPLTPSFSEFRFQ